MKKLRLLIVEDVEQELESFRDDLEDYTRETNRDIDLVECKTLEEALDKLDNSFDGAIIDLKLANHRSNEGNQVVEKIRESFFRIPIAIFTGNPGDWDPDLNEKTILIDVFTKGETGNYELLDRFWEIYNTGLTRIMGGRGLIEQRLSEVLLKNLLPQIQTWVSYGAENTERTEKAFLRYTLNHLFQLLEEDQGHCFPEEVYLYPPVLDKITTGSMVKENNQWFVVLSPACDLVVRGGQLNTERILFIEIEKETNIIDKALNRLRRITDEEEKERVKKDILQRLSRNSHTFYYHWLPPVKFKISDDEFLDFDGGFLNFRKLEALSMTKFRTRFEKPAIQISPFFVKDIVSRFSSYYARQGQPDIDSEDFIVRYTT